MQPQTQPRALAARLAPYFDAIASARGIFSWLQIASALEGCGVTIPAKNDRHRAIYLLRAHKRSEKFRGRFKQLTIPAIALEPILTKETPPQSPQQSVPQNVQQNAQQEAQQKPITDPTVSNGPPPLPPMPRRIKKPDLKSMIQDFYPAK